MTDKKELSEPWGVTCCRATIRKTGGSTHCVDKSNSEPNATIAAPTEWTFLEIKHIKTKRKTMLR